MFLFKQKTAYELRISDWSSDVCSSDLRWRIWLQVLDRSPSQSGRAGIRMSDRHTPLVLTKSLDQNITYYLSGPMSGYKNYNYDAFEEAYTALELLGLTLNSPHNLPWPEDHELITERALWKNMKIG